MSQGKDRTAFSGALAWSVIASGLAVGIALGWVALAKPGGQRAPATGPLVIDPKSLDLGEVWVRPNFSHELEVRNVTSQPVDVEVTGSCACLKLEPGRFTLPANTSRPIRLELDLSPGPAEPGLRSIAQEITTRVTTGGGVWSRTWTLQGRARDLLLSKHDIALGEVVAGMVPDPRDLILKFAMPVQSVSAHADGVRCESKPLGSTGSEFQLHVKPDAGLFAKPGDVAILLRLALQPRGPAPLPEQFLPLSARVVPDVVMLPDRILLQGPAASSTITLHSRTGTPFRVLEWKLPEGATIDVIEPKDRQHFATRWEIRLSGNGQKWTRSWEVQLESERAVVAGPLTAWIISEPAVKTTVSSSSR